jgi:hypothetical protein
MYILVIHRRSAGFDVELRFMSSRGKKIVRVYEDVAKEDLRAVCTTLLETALGEIATPL